jgi:hypothetical protein
MLPLLGAVAGDTGARNVTGSAITGILVVDWIMWLVEGCDGAKPCKAGDIDVPAEWGC